jgi:peptidyl-prolyl cis-trans isomerase SurA
VQSQALCLAPFNAPACLENKPVATAEPTMMFDKFTRCRGLLAAMTVIVASVLPTIGHAEEGVVIVGGGLITELDIAQRSKLDQVGTRKTPSREEVIEELRNEEIKVQGASNLGLVISDLEVDSAFAKMAGRMRLTLEQFTQALARSGIAAETLKHRIRADVACERYVCPPRNPPP